MRVIVAHSETGEIYFDESDPEDCLPLARQERLSPEEYLAEHEKLKAEEKRRKEEQILQARRAEQERIEAEKRIEQEQKEIERKNKIDLFTFEEDNLFEYAPIFHPSSGNKYSVIHYKGTKPEQISGDTPNGTGKSLLLGKYTTIDFNWIHTFSVWIKTEGKGNVCYFTDNNKKSEFACNKSQLIYKYNGNTIVVAENNPFLDKQWHLLTVVRIHNEYNKFYIDGKLIKQANIQHSKPVLNTVQMSGNDGEIKIDNLRFSTLVLTDEEIAAIYEEEKQ
jgi:hypothetical protein